MTTSSARARSPTRCGGGSRPVSQPDAARGEEADALLAEEPACGLGRVARVGVVREKADERAAASEPEGREEERQDRLGDTGSSGCVHEGPQALARRELVGKRPENRLRRLRGARLVHGEGAKTGSAQGPIYDARRRRRLRI